jgi:3-hydroxyisobutyrate dehydrogenase-like beta-hydroxyacid dehydrogenase
MRVGVLGTGIVGRSVAGKLAARGMEMALPLWLAIVTASNDPMFNFSIVR